MTGETEKRLPRRAFEWLLYGNLAEDRKKLPKFGAKTLIFRILGVFTTGYVAIQLYVFHRQLDSIPYEIVHAWMIWLLGYIVLKESFRWISLGASNHFGEIFVLLIVGTFCWMETFNLYQHWFRGKPYLKIPGGYYESMIEAFILLVLSSISSALHHKKGK